MEKKIEKQVAEKIRARGFFVYHAECMERGMPDILALDRRTGGFLFCEIKSFGGRYRPEQLAWLREHQAKNVFLLEELYDGYRLTADGKDCVCKNLDEVVTNMLLFYRDEFNR